MKLLPTPNFFGMCVFFPIWRLTHVFFNVGSFKKNTRDSSSKDWWFEMRSSFGMWSCHNKKPKGGCFAIVLFHDCQRKNGTPPKTNIAPGRPSQKETHLNQPQCFRFYVSGRVPLQFFFPDQFFCFGNCAFLLSLSLQIIWSLFDMLEVPATQDADSSSIPIHLHLDGWNQANQLIHSSPLPSFMGGFRVILSVHLPLDWGG